MPEFNQNYNFNSLYICLLLIAYNIYNSNYDLVNILGIYLLLKNLSFEVNNRIIYININTIIVYNIKI